MHKAVAALITAFSLAWLPTPVAAATTEQELTVRSDSMTIEELKGEIRFQGNVVLNYQEAVLNCDTLVLLTEEPSPSGVKRGVAEGNVVITHLGDTARADRAEFDVASGEVVLTGSPVLTRETNIINATVIRYSMNSGIARFEGPVEATIIAPEEKR